MRVDGLADVHRVAAHLDRQRGLADHVAGIGADDASADKSGDLKQTVRCATAGAKIEVKSAIKGTGDGALTGTWEETVYNLKGDISGQTTERGFRVEVRSADLSANMDLLLKDKQQMIELQFFNSTLMGLTIMLTKGNPSAAAAAP